MWDDREHSALWSPREMQMIPVLGLCMLRFSNWKTCPGLSDAWISNGLPGKDMALCRTYREIISLQDWMTPTQWNSRSLS